MGGRSNQYTGLEFAKSSKHKQASEASGNSAPNSFTHRWLCFVLTVHKSEEQHLRKWFSRLLIVFHLIIFGIWSTYWGKLKQRFTNIALEGWADNCIRVVLSIEICVVFAASIWVLMQENGVKSKISRTSKALIFLLKIHYFLAFPLLLGLYSRDLFYLQGVKVLWTWLMILAGACLLVPIEMSWSSLPTSNPLSRPSGMASASLYGLQCFQLLLQGFISGQTRLGLTIALLSFTSLFVLQGAYLYLPHLRLYWNYKTQIIMSIGLSAVVILRLSVFVVMIFPHDTPLLSMVLIVGTIISAACKATFSWERGKLLRSLTYLHGKGGFAEFLTVWQRELALSNVFSSSISGVGSLDSLSLELYKASITQQKQSRGHKPLLTVTGGDAEAVPRETTQYQSPRMFSPRMTDFRFDTEAHPEQNHHQHLDETTEGPDFLWLYYSCLVSKRLTKVEDLKAILLFEIVFLNRCLLSVAGHLQILRRLLGQYATRSSDLFILESLFQSRLELQSESVSKDRDGRVTLSEILIFLARENEQDTNLNMRAPLDAKDRFTWMLSDINQLIQAKSHIYTKLLSSSAQKSSYFYRKNWQAQDASHRIESQLESLITSPSSPSFVFSAAVSYYLKLRFDIIKAERVFKSYQNKLNKMNLQAANHQIRIISADNSLCDSVTLRLCVSNDQNLGAITDISAGYQELVGEPEGGNPLGLSVNTLFPGELATLHAVMMRNLRNETIFNSQRDFFLNGFDKSLRDIRFLLKLDNSIQNGLTVLALLRIMTLDADTFCLLANQQGALVAAQDHVWAALEVGTQTDSLENKNVEQLAVTAKVQLDLYSLLIKVVATDDSEDENHSPQHVSVDERRGTETGDKTHLQSSRWTQSKIGKYSKGRMVEANSKIRAHSVDRLREKVMRVYDMIAEAGVSHQLGGATLDRGFIMWAEQMKFGERLYFRIKVKKTFMHGTQLDRSLSEEGAAHIDDHKAKSDFEQMLRGSEFSDNTVSFEQFLEILGQETPIKDYLQEVTREKLDQSVKESIEWLCEYYLGHKYAPMDATTNVTKTYHQFVSVVPSNTTSAKKPETQRLTFGQLVQLKLNRVPSSLLAKNLSVVDQAGSSLGELHDTAPKPLADPALGSHADLAVHRPPFLTDPSSPGRPPTDSGLRGRHELLRDSSTPNFKKMELSDVNSKNNRRESHKTIKRMDTNQKRAKNYANNHKLPVSNTLAYQMLLSPVSMQGVSSSRVNQIESDSSGKHDQHHPQLKDMMEREDPKLEVSHQSDNRTSVFSALVRRVFRTHAVDESVSSKKKLTGMSAAKILELAQKHAFLAQTHRAVTYLLQHLTTFKTARRQETGAADNDKNASVSTSTASSRGAHMLKVVNSTLATQKKGSLVYLFTLLLALFATGLFAAIQVVFASLSEYNESNLNNYGIVAQYIFLDRKLIQGAEIGNYLYEHSMAVFDRDDYLGIKQNFSEFLPSTLNSSSYLFDRIIEAKTDLSNAIRSISKQTAFTISQKDLDEVSSQTFRQEQVLYMDRLANLSSTKTLIWNVTFFTSIMYAVDLLDSNLKTMQEMHKLAWQTDFNVNLNMSMQDRLKKLNASKLGYDIAVFNDILAKMTPRFNQIIETLLTNSVDRHFSQLFLVMYLALVWMLLMIISNVWVGLRINAIQQEYLHNYALLKPWEILLLAEDLEKITDLFTKQALNEVSHINQFLDFNLRSRLNVLNERAARLQERLSKDKDKLSVSTRFVHNFWFGSSKFTFAVVMLAAVMLGLLITTIYTFLSINSRRLGAQMLQYESHKAMLECTKNYLSVVLLSIYGYYIDIAGTKITDNAFAGSIDNFIVFQTEKRREFAFYYGEEQAKIIDDISFSNICDRMLIVPVLKANTGAFYDVCTKMNDGSATKGITGYFQYQKLFLERIRSVIIQRYPDYLEASKQTRPATSLMHELFASRYVEMRVGNWLMFNIYYYVINDVTSKAVASIKEQLDSLVSQTMQSVSILIFTITFAAVAYLLRLQQAEILTCYQTFHLIDPYFLMNNRYLQFRFKAAYKGIE